MPYQPYVVGFVFTPDRQEVALIRKLRPKWQAGRLNGIGGKVEPGESPLEAMVREFEEETGVRIGPFKWTRAVRMEAPTWEINFFTSFTDRVGEVQSKTDEEVGIYPVRTLWQQETISNLRWLVPLMLDPDMQWPMDMRHA